MLQRFAVGRRVCAGLVVAMLAAWAPAGTARADAPPQRLIVTYRSPPSGLSAASTAARTAAAALPADGSRILRTYATLPIVTVSATAEGRRRLEASPDVVSVTPDRVLHTLDDTPTAAPDAYRTSDALPTVSGSGWTVAVVDTGVDTSHPYLGGRTGAGVDGQGDGGACFAINCPGGGSTEFGVASAQPCPVAGCDHGTHVAGIALGGAGTAGPGGMAPEANLYPVRVFSTSTNPMDCGGAASCSTAFSSDVIAALDHIAGQAAHYRFAAVNMSLGDDQTWTVPCMGVDVPMETAIQQLASAGIAVTVASGNHHSTTGIAFPACAAGSISVGALDGAGQVVASFSDAAPGLSLLAPGTSIISSVPGGLFATKSGTSMAAPAVAGAFALAREAAPSTPLADLLQVFRSTGTPAPDQRPGANGASYPALNIVAALANLGHAPPGPGGGGGGGGESFHGLSTPQRLVDTRTGIGGGRLGTGATLAVAVPGIPASGGNVPAASLNVTAVGADGPGFLTVFPCGQGTPVVSSVNYTGPAPVANKVVVAVPADGRVCIFTMAGTDVVVDFDGWLAAGHPFQAMAPQRLLDTRGSGVPLTDVALPVVPAGAGGAVVNLTITQPAADGFATLYPCGGSLPLASNLNFRAGATVPGAALVPVDTLGRLCVHTSTPAHVIVDIAGSLAAGFTPQVPTRQLDTRLAGGPPVTDAVLPVVALPGAEGLALTLTITEPTAAGYATVYPCGQAPPLVSNVNYVAGQTIANAVIATPDSIGRVCVHSFVPAHIVVDVSGFFT